MLVKSPRNASVRRFAHDVWVNVAAYLVHRNNSARGSFATGSRDFCAYNVAHDAIRLLGFLSSPHQDDSRTLASSAVGGLCFHGTTPSLPCRSAPILAAPSVAAPIHAPPCPIPRAPLAVPVPFLALRALPRLCRPFRAGPLPRSSLAVSSALRSGRCPSTPIRFHDRPLPLHTRASPCHPCRFDAVRFSPLTSIPRPRSSRSHACRVRPLALPSHSEPIPSLPFLFPPSHSSSTFVPCLAAPVASVPCRCQPRLVRPVLANPGPNPPRLRRARSMRAATRSETLSASPYAQPA